MAWLSLAQAKSKANVTANSLAAAKTVITWLTENGYCFSTAHVHPINTTFSRSGISFKQELDVESFEIHGITKDLAEWLCRWRQEDTTIVWDMYGIDSKGEIYTVEATYGKPYFTTSSVYYWIGGAGNSKSVSGANRPVAISSTADNSDAGIRVELENGRANEAGGWHVTMTRTVFFCPDYSSNSSGRMNPAFIPVPPKEASDGIVVSTNKQKTLVAYDGGTPVYQNVTQTVREYRYLTAAAAATKVTSEAKNASRVIDVRVLVSWGTGGSTYKNVQVRGGGSNGTTAATDVVPTSRPMGNGYYCVSANEITYQVTTS